MTDHNLESTRLGLFCDYYFMKTISRLPYKCRKLSLWSKTTFTKIMNELFPLIKRAVCIPRKPPCQSISIASTPWQSNSDIPSSSNSRQIFLQASLLSRCLFQFLFEKGIESLPQTQILQSVFLFNLRV